jgi:hypothetical protein
LSSSREPLSPSSQQTKFVGFSVLVSPRTCSIDSKLFRPVANRSAYGLEARGARLVAQFREDLAFDLGVGLAIGRGNKLFRDKEN